MKKSVLPTLALCCFLAGCSPSQESQATIAAISETLAPTVTVSPLPATIDVNQLDNCTVAISLKEGDAYVDDAGAMQMKVTVYSYDLYDMVDIAQLKVGDIITIRQQDVKITSLERTEYGAMVINGGLDLGGYELQSDDSGVFYENGYSDVKSWQELGEATIRVSPDFLYTDSSDLDKEPVTYHPGDFLINNTGIDYHFTPYNTRIVIENGCIIAMYRVYTP